MFNAQNGHGHATSTTSRRGRLWAVMVSATVALALGAPALCAPSQTQSGGVTTNVIKPGSARSMDSYGRSFFGGAKVNSGLLPQIGTSSGMPKPGTSVDRYGGSFYNSNRTTNPFTSQGTIPPPGHNFGISSFGGPRLGGTSYMGMPLSIRPNGVGGLGNRNRNFVTPLGNGANGPIGTYGGSSFGSSAGGSVR